MRGGCRCRSGWSGGTRSWLEGAGPASAGCAAGAERALWAAVSRLQSKRQEHPRAAPGLTEEHGENLGGAAPIDPLGSRHRVLRDIEQFSKLFPWPLLLLILFHGGILRRLCRVAKEHWIRSPKSGARGSRLLPLTKYRLGS